MKNLFFYILNKIKSIFKKNKKYIINQNNMYQNTTYYNDSYNSYYLHDNIDYKKTIPDDISTLIFLGFK